MEASASVPTPSPSPSELSVFGSVASGSRGSDEARERDGASFLTQANALLRKNLTFQKRNLKTNTCIVIYPIFVCGLLIVLQTMINNELHKPQYRCGCRCIPVNGTSTCQKVCGIQYSSPGQARSCAIPSPSKWPALMQVPQPQYRAANNSHLPFADLTDSSCRLSGSCATTVIFTGQNQTLAQTLARNLFPLMDSSSLNFSDYLTLLSQVVPGTDDGHTLYTLYVEPAVISNRPLYYIQPFCLYNNSSKCTINYQGLSITKDLVCVQGLTLWRNSSSMINDELFRGYQQSNSEKKLEEFLTAYDFVDTSEKSFNVDIWYNSTYKKNTAYKIALQRIPRSLNVAANAFLKFLKGAGVSMEFEFVKETPKVATELRLEFSSLLGPLFFAWTIQLLLPVMLTHLVYEKQQKLKMMMKIHGLNDGPYWLISYFYFLLISVAYMICFVIFGSLIGLNFFRLNDYSLQVAFYFISINHQIVLAFLLASFFSTVKTATVIGYIWVLGSGLLSDFLFRFFLEDPSFPKAWVILMELVPGFSLYRGLYEFGQYSFSGSAMGAKGMNWVDLNSSEDGMIIAMIIMVLEWMVLLPLAFYLDQVSFFGSGSCKEPLFILNFLKKNKKKKKIIMASSPSPQFSFRRQGSAKVSIDVDNKPDISQERKLVEKLVLEGNRSYAVVSDNLRKVYLGRDGNPDKPAVKGLSLALAQGECFGMLGPNGAGKTSFIHMMIGLIKPTSGTAYVQGMDIRTDMKGIYTNVGVCPQHDLLWETLTGREHLLFYGRLKNLKGGTLTQAVDESLKSVNLVYGGVGDKQVRTYSGGMKRRLSVAISLIGDPKVVYMDEPSTGLDPVSRNNLWNIIKHAKKDRAIILTTHSMEEAEVLCDRLGIFVDGRFQCLGNPKELKARYGGSYVLTMNTAAEQEQEVETLVLCFFPKAKKIYQISGTQKFEIPKQETRISDIFQAIEKAKSCFTIYGWGLADITLEDVFIKVAKGAQALDVLS